MGLAPAPWAGAAVPAQIAITEWMYNPTLSANAEFVEVTNIGGAPLDMTGYSFDDDSRTPGTFSLAALGTLAPGESGLIIEKTAAAFRTEWSLSGSVKIADANTNNLGRSDEINIFNGTTLADRLTYDDLTKFPGTIRTVGKSGAPTTCLGLGANNVGLWVLSAVGDGRGSRASLSGDVASPGTTPLGACGPVTIVGGNGSGNASNLPCQPEGPSGTGPAPVGAQPWPGGSSVTVADQTCAWKTTTGPEGRDMSGLVFDPNDAGVLWAVKNKNWVFRLVQQGGLWVPDTANDWGSGKQIFFPGGTGQPDSEGLTVGGDGALYITTERNNASNTFALNSVLRFDPTVAGSTLTSTRQWDLTSAFPELIVPGGNKDKANLGFEGVSFVPDTYLVQNAFIDQSTGTVYRPSDYPAHDTGLFFAALENDGKLYAYALNDDGTAHRVAVVDTGMGHVMDVQFDRDLQRIWALCDNTCAVSSTVLKVDATGTIVPDVVYARPTGLPNVNIEGFAIAPDTTCVGGVKKAVWSDDGLAGPGQEGHALYNGTFPCGLDLGRQGATLCQPGSYSSAGIAPCTPAPAGTFVAISGATSATPCPAGSYSATTGSTSCTPAPAGTFVATAGATSATPCPAGTFSATTGSTSCTLAGLGFFVAVTGAVAQTPCPAGTTTLVMGATSCIVTPSSLSAAIRSFFGGDAGGANGLIAKVNEIASAPNANAKAGVLTAFGNQIDAKVGKSLTPAQAALLKQLALSL